MRSIQQISRRGQKKGFASVPQIACVKACIKRFKKLIDVKRIFPYTAPVPVLERQFGEVSEGC